MTCLVENGQPRERGVRMGRHSIRAQFMGIVILLSLSFAALSLTAYQNICGLLDKKNHSYAMNSSLAYAYSMNDLYLRVTNISGLLATNGDVLAFLAGPLDENTGAVPSSIPPPCWTTFGNGWAAAGAFSVLAWWRSGF